MTYSPIGILGALAWDIIIMATSSPESERTATALRFLCNLVVPIIGYGDFVLTTLKIRENPLCPVPGRTHI